MKTTDLFTNNRSAKRLNDSLAKTFGQKLNLESFSIEQLEDARNKLRTQIYTARSGSNFNETVENETLSKAQFMHDAIVAELMDRNEPIVDATQFEAEDTLETQVASIMKQFDEDMNDIGGYGMPDDDKIAEMLRQGDVEGALDYVYGSYADQDGGELRDMDRYIESLQDEFEDLAQRGDNADDSKDEFATFKQGESAPPTAKGERMVKHIKKGYADDGKLTKKEKSIAYATAWKAHNKEEDIQTELSTNTLKSYQDKAGKDIVNTMTSGDHMTTDKSAKKVMNRMKGSEKADNKIWKRNESIEQTGDDMRNLREGEIQQASAIVTAKTMVDRVGRWIEELSGMENDTLLQLGDSIRDEMGQEQAKAFIQAVAPAIQQALDTLKGTRDTLSTGVRSLASGEQPTDMLGGEPGADMAAPAEPDAMNPAADDMTGEPAGDDFDAAEPAAGGLGDAGREQRESIDRQSRLLKVLAG